MSEPGWESTSVDAARARLTDPSCPVQELAAICQAHPSLSAQAVWHPSSTPDFARWLATSSDPAVAAPALARLGQQQQPAAPTHPTVAPTTTPTVAPEGPRRRKGPLLIAFVGLLVLALGVGAAWWFWPRGGGPAVAPDFRTEPGLKSLAASSIVPGGITAEGGFAYDTYGGRGTGYALALWRLGADGVDGFGLVDLNDMTLRWTHGIDTDQAQTYDYRVGDGLLALHMQMYTAPHEGSLGIYDLEAGELRTATTRRDVSQLVWVRESSIGIVDTEGRLAALDPSDLDKTLWTSPRPIAIAANYEYVGSDGLGDIVLDEYVLTRDGYVSIVTGAQADFAADAGQHGVWLAALDGGGDDELVRYQSDDSSSVGFRVTGFDHRKDEITWQLPGTSYVTKSGNLLVATGQGGITAYRVAGSSLEPEWSYPCDCWLGTTSREHVVVVSRASEDDAWSKVTVLHTPSGRQLGAVESIESVYQGATLGDSVLYVTWLRRASAGIEIAAYDLRQPGLPELWRSPLLEDTQADFGDHLVLMRQDPHDPVIGRLTDDAPPDWSPFQ